MHNPAPHQHTAIGALQHEMPGVFKKRDDRIDHMEKSIDDIRSDVQNLGPTRARATPSTNNEQPDGVQTR